MNTPTVARALQKIRNPQLRSAQQRAYRARYPEKYRAHYRKAAHKKQGIFPTRPCPPHCELCGKPPKKRALAADHDHVTGNFRGWLCISCNTALGHLGDSLEGLARAMVYIAGARS